MPLSKRDRPRLSDLFALETLDLVSGDAPTAFSPSRTGMDALAYPDGHPVLEMRKAWRRGDLFDQAGNGIFDLRRNVGPDAINRPTDVARVQTALARTGALDLGETDGPTGIYGQPLGDRIEKLQRENGLKTDGTLNPRGPTIRLLKKQIAGADEDPQKTPTATRQAAPASFPAIPDYKKDIIAAQGNTWAEWGKPVNKLPDIGNNERRAYAEIFAAEGGNRPDPGSPTVVSGITPIQWEDLLQYGHLPPNLKRKKPEDLTIGEKAIVYREIMDRTLHAVGGHAALERLPDGEVAAALADPLFRNGMSGGAIVIQRAVEKVSGKSLVPGRPAARRDNRHNVVGEKTFREFARLSSNPATRRHVLDALSEEKNNYTKERKRDNAGERSRTGHFRFPESKVPQ